MRQHSLRLLNGIIAAVILTIAIPAFGQQSAAPSGIGVVTAIQGQATVARQALPAASPLHFKDDVFFRDQVATKERSTVRLLLGGKGVVTVREQSQVTLDETVAPDGARRSVLSVLAGKIAATIAHALMRPGDEVEVRTPDAVAAVRGTVLIAEYIPPKQNAAAQKPVLLASSAPGPFLAQAGGTSGGQSNFFVLSGNVTITPQGQPPVTLGPLQALSVTATPGGVRPGTVQNITPDQLAQIVQGLDAGRPLIGEAGGVAAAQAILASLLADALVNLTGGGVVLTTPVVGCNPCIPPPPPPVGNSTENTLPSGVLLSLNNTAILMSGTPIAEFTSGSANSIVPLEMSNPGLVLATSPILPVSGNSITHSGTLISLNDSLLTGFDPAAVFGPTTSFDTITNVTSPTFDPTTIIGPTAPILRITGTSLTNTGGALLSMTGSSGPVTLDLLLSHLEGGSLIGLSGLFSFGSFLSLEGGSLTATGPGLDATNSGVFIGGPVFALRGGSRVAWSGGGPLIRLNSSTLFAGGGFGDSDGTGNVVAISGAPGDTAVMLDATDSQIFFGPNRIPNAGATDTDFNSFSAPSGVPLFRLTGTGVDPITGVDHRTTYIDSDPDGELIPHSDGTSTFDGLFLVAKNSDITIAGKVLDVCCGQHLTTTTTGPLIRLDNTTIFVGGNFVQVCCGNSVSSAPSSLTVSGPILNAASGSSLNMGGSLLNIANGGQLTSTTTDSIFTLNGGTHTVGTVLQMDNGLLTASAPIIQLITGATLNTNNVNGAMQLFQSSVTSNGPVIGLNNSTLQVNNGPLLSLTGGSTMTVNGDFATLMNGAKVLVQNGPMISVAGTGSTLTINGALVNFATAHPTTNQVSITNSIPATRVDRSSNVAIPVSEATGGVVSITNPTLIRNPNNGTLSVTCATGCADTTNPASVIQVSGGGKVNIK